MAEIMSAMLFEKKARALVARRRRPPFAGQWTLPATVVGEHEAAEEALRRHAREQFGLALAADAEEFVETVYLDDAGAHYIANIFRAELPAGPMRFNADGDYDDAKWLGAQELDLVAMPPDLRTPLLQILTAPEALHETNWDRMAAELATTALPLAEREGQPPAPETQSAPPPDNRAGWDAIAKAYQEEVYGDRDVGRLKWSWAVYEVELHVLGDVRGKRALVLGCGGGQDVVALATMGAVAVGVDFSTKQVEYAKKYLVHHPADNASFVEEDVTDLSRFDDESFDLAVSIHALGHVERAELVLAEAARVLKPGGVLAIAVQHPMHHGRESTEPFGLTRPYWSGARDWRWEFETGLGAEFRAYPRTIEQWFDVLTGAGFRVERVIEPREGRIPADARHVDQRLARLAPYTLIIKATKQ